VLRVLDEAFVRYQLYSHSHIVPPLGSFNDGKRCGYYYAYAEGVEGFPWEIRTEGGGWESVDVREWNVFSNGFTGYGLMVCDDISDFDGGTAKNVVHARSTAIDYDNPRLPPTWTRIDFGIRSMRFDLERFKTAMARNEHMLEQTDHRTAVLAAQFYHDAGNMPAKELDELRELVFDFRQRQLLESQRTATK
jgi:hypothetical protein